MDIEQYLDRIDYKGPSSPNLQVLKDLCRAHVLAIPYSNACIFSNIPLSLDLCAIYKRIVVKHDGGTCVELNALFGWLLAKLGFYIKNGQGRFFIENEFTVQFHHLTPVVSMTEMVVCSNWYSVLFFTEIF